MQILKQETEKTKYNILEGLVPFLSDNKFQFGIVSAMLLIFYGSRLYMPNVGIDTQIMIDHPGTLYNWTGIGRQGLVVSKILLGNIQLNPYFSTSMGYIFLVVALIFWSFLFYRVGNIKGADLTIFSLIFLIHPVFVEQFYFVLQILEFSFAMILVPLALIVEFNGAINNNKKITLLSISLMVWAFSSYQLFILLYVSGVIFCLLLIYRNQTLDGDNPPNIGLYFRLIARLITTFVIAVFVNAVITKLFFSNSQYLDSQILWGQLPLESCLNNILRHFKQVVTGEGIFYSWGYVLSLSLMMASVVYDFFKKKDSLRWLWIFVVVLFESLPFILTVFLGNTPSIRTQFLLPFVIACNITYFSYKISSIRVKIIPIFLGISIIWAQGHSVQRLHYTDDVRFSGDYLLAQSVSSMINNKYGSVTKPLAFVGVKEPYKNPATTDGEMIGISLFSWGDFATPHYLHTTVSIISFMRSVGLDVKGVISQDQIQKAREFAYNMPSWPDNESIKDVGEFIVIKLSEDEYYADDLMVPDTQRVSIKDINFSNDITRWSVDSIQLVENVLTIKGWCFKDGVSSEGSKIVVYLYDEQNGQYYQIASAQNKRPDVNAFFSSEIDYNFSGYIAKGDISKFDSTDLDKYRIILGYTKNTETLFMDTGERLHIK